MLDYGVMLALAVDLADRQPYGSKDFIAGLQFALKLYTFLRKKKSSSEWKSDKL